MFGKETFAGNSVFYAGVKYTQGGLKERNTHALHNTRSKGLLNEEVCGRANEVAASACFIALVLEWKKYICCPKVFRLKA